MSVEGFSPDIHSPPIRSFLKFHMYSDLNVLNLKSLIGLLKYMHG